MPAAKSIKFHKNGVGDGAGAGGGTAGLTVLTAYSTAHISAERPHTGLFQ